MLGKEIVPYKRIVHQPFITLGINQAKVNLARGKAHVRGVHRHKRTHELAGVHWAEEVALHIFALLLFACLGEWNGLGTVQVIAPGCWLGRSRVELPGGHDQRGSLLG